MKVPDYDLCIIRMCFKVQMTTAVINKENVTKSFFNQELDTGIMMLVIK